MITSTLTISRYLPKQKAKIAFKVNDIKSLNRSFRLRHIATEFQCVYFYFYFAVIKLKQFVNTVVE